MDIAIIGGGPAGLRAAEVASAQGATVTVFDAKASVGRKFLVAGKGGLNLTKSEPLEDFLRSYRGPNLPADLWATLITAFDPAALRAWSAELGVETFAASTGRVYPREMKAAPLLRRWVQRLRAQGVEFALHHRWTGLRRDEEIHLEFVTAEGPRSVRPRAAVLALGGGSWPDTGSDAEWILGLERCGINITPLQPANCGWEVDWPPALLADAEGQPLKNLSVRAAETTVRGELVITRHGLEGGAIYQLGPVLRAQKHPAVILDFKADVEVADLIRKLGPLRRNFLAEARSRWRLSPGAFALLQHFAPPDVHTSTEALARAAKALTLPLLRPRPLAEAISSAGGVAWSELDETLMLKTHPGVFCAGEMIDWEAPTGGYLMQGCFATGTWAGRCAREWATRH